jgi:hypothetical protein
MAGYPKPFKFEPVRPEKYIGDPTKIVMRSSWELKLARWCDMNPSVISWTSEELVIPYYSRADQKMRRYFMDFVIKMRVSDGTVITYMIEVKPEKQTVMPKGGRGRSQKTVLNETYAFMVNTDKWNAANEYARKHGMVFKIMTEKELGIVK